MACKLSDDKLCNLQLNVTFRMDLFHHHRQIPVSSCWSSFGGQQGWCPAQPADWVPVWRPGPCWRFPPLQSCRCTSPSSGSPARRPLRQTASDLAHQGPAGCTPDWRQSSSGSPDSRWACPASSRCWKSLACAPSPSASSPTSAGESPLDNPLVLAIGSPGDFRCFMHFSKISYKVLPSQWL